MFNKYKILKILVVLSALTLLSGCASSSQYQNKTNIQSSIPSYQNIAPRNNYYAELQKEFKENIRKQLKETNNYENYSSSNAINHKKEDRLFIYKQLMKRKNF